VVKRMEPKLQKFMYTLRTTYRIMELT
jgi:hypothetical protein